MASLELSDGLMAGLPARIVRLNVDVGNSANMTFAQLRTASGLLPKKDSSFSLQYSIGNIAICQGSVPASADDVMTAASRSADILVNWLMKNISPGAPYPGQNTANDFAITNESTNPIQINSIYRAAVASGVASWFWWMVRWSNGSTIQDTHLHAIIGTVGGVGSGADLEIPDVNIVSGQSYRLRNLRINFPDNWTY